MRLRERRVVRDDGEGLAWDIVWDERDRFGEWVKQNSLGPFRGFSNDHNRQHYLFYGGGVLSEVVHDAFPLQKVFDAWEGEYRRVVAVKHIPFGKCFPNILDGYFRSEKYKFVSWDKLENDDFFREAARCLSS